MDERDGLQSRITDFLGTLPSYCFAEWEYAYGTIVCPMGLEVLRRFPESASGTSPRKHTVPLNAPAAADRKHGREIDL